MQHELDSGKIVNSYDVFLIKKHILIVLNDGTNTPPYAIFDFNERGIGDDALDTQALLKAKAGEDICSDAGYDSNKGYISLNGLQRLTEMGIFLFNFKDVMDKLYLEV